MKEKIRHYILPLSILIAATYLVYAQNLSDQFLLFWDDGDYIVHNEAIKGLSFDHLKEAFSHVYVGNYAPLHIISYMLDYTFWGLNPSGYVFVNITLHLLNGILFYFIVKRLTGHLQVAWIAAFVFLLHPVQVESVAWISQRKNLLSMVFFLLSFHCYLAHKEKNTENRSYYYVLSLLTFSASLLTKSVAVILPLVLVLFDYCYLGKDERKGGIKDKIPYAVAAAAIALVAIKSQSPELGGGRTTYHGNSPLATFYTMLTVVASYLKLLVWPAHLNALYAPPIKTQIDVSVALSALLVCSLIILAVFLYRRKRTLFFWFALFFIGLLPVSQIVPIVTLMNDRYLYFPMLGAAPFFAALFFSGVQKAEALRKVTLVVILCLILVLLPLLSWQRSSVWQDDITLWSDVIGKEPMSAKAQYNLGCSYLQSNFNDRALSAFTRAITANAGTDKTLESNILYNMGIIYTNRGDLDKAREYYSIAIKNKPDNYLALDNLGIVSYRSGDLQNAEIYFKRALAITADSAKITLSLGDVYHDQKKYELARKNYQKVVALKGMSPELAYKLAGIESLSGHPREALQLLAYALRGGYADSARIQKDPDFNSLKTLPSFKELLHK